MNTLTLTLGGEPGQYRLLYGTNETSASVRCPQCQQWGTLEDHTIEPDGSVSPSLDCPTDGCQFHEFVELENWSEVMSTCQ